jgi:hypothetical protein
MAFIGHHIHQTKVGGRPSNGPGRLKRQRFRLRPSASLRQDPDASAAPPTVGTERSLVGGYRYPSRIHGGLVPRVLHRRAAPAAPSLAGAFAPGRGLGSLFHLVAGMITHPWRDIPVNPRNLFAHSPSCRARHNVFTIFPPRIPATRLIASAVRSKADVTGISHAISHAKICIHAFAFTIERSQTAARFFSQLLREQINPVMRFCWNRKNLLA